jgi:hypothetical protein
MAASEVQISDRETPLHKMETVYRRLIEALSTVGSPHGAMRDTETPEPRRGQMPPEEVRNSPAD